LHLFLCHTHISAFSLIYHDMLCNSSGFLPRFWHSLHISSHFMVFVVPCFVLLKVFVLFKNIGNWNIVLRYCAWKSFSVCMLGWYWYIRIIWIAIFVFVILGHLIYSCYKTTFFMELTWTNIFCGVTFGDIFI